MQQFNDIIVKDGQIVLSHVPFPDGQHVHVVVTEVVRPVSIGNESSEGHVVSQLAKLAGKAKGLPPDLAERHDHYRRERL
jgi:calcineurin-like phosphoesterase family protein